MQACAFACPCELRGAIAATYATVLALGEGGVQAALDAAVASAASVSSPASREPREALDAPLGMSSAKAALDAAVAERTGAVANTASYCCKCRRITPNLNPASSVQENVMHWRRQRAYFIACARFIADWPKVARGSRQRSRRKKQVKVEADEEG